MTIMAPAGTKIFGGVDTHQDLHAAAVIDKDGSVLETRQFPTTRHGYLTLIAWMRGFGNLERVGVECTGSYGAGLARYFAKEGTPVFEVTHPDKGLRRTKGKDDNIDAIAAAQAVRSGNRVRIAKDRSGAVEALRVLRTTRKSAVRARRAALQQLHNTIVAAPDSIRAQYRGRTRMALLRELSASRPERGGFRDQAVATRLALKSIALRIVKLGDEISDLDAMIQPLVAELAPSLLGLSGVGVEVAGEFLVTAGDNPGRLVSEASFAMLCGACPLPASSGKTVRHRLNRGGNRQANSALHMVVVSRMRTDERTKAYVERRSAEGLSKREIMRCLKRYVAREVYKVLTA